MLQIGTLKIKSPLIQAALAGVSDLTFRLLNRKFGCELALVEMINVRSLGYRSRRTQAMLGTTRRDRPLGVQLLGSEPPYILRGLDILKKYRFDLIDFNAACPAPKVVRRGEGASLLKDPVKLERLARLLVAHSPVPVTVKIRAGWDRNSINAAEVAKRLEDAGVCAVAVHGRTRMQGYDERVDYRIIKKVKQSVKIPVIASGDILSPLLAKKMFDETGVDAVLIARGSFGNPWIFRETARYLADGTLPGRPDPEEVADVMREHLRGCIKLYGERRGVAFFHKFFAWYTRGLRNVRQLRELAYHAKTGRQMRAAIDACRILEWASHKPALEAG